MTEISSELAAIIEAIPRDFADPGADFLAVREMFAPFHGHPVSPGFDVREVSYGGVSCGQYLAAQGGDLVVFHCHGGAFVSCPLETYHFYGELIARRTACQVVMPDYRLAPENLFPAAHDDVFMAYRGLLESGVEPGKVVVMGESCGGSLALGALLRARDAGLPMPACFVSLTGWFDLSVSGVEFENRDPFLTPEWVRRRGRDYAGEHMALDDPRLSPAFADLHGLPPLYLQVGQMDTVREGALMLGVAALRSGVEVHLEGWPGMIHGWHGLANAGVPEADAAWRAISGFLDRYRP